MNENDPAKMREEDKQAVRVILNGLVLLDVGLFPGKHAVALEEFRGLIIAVKDQTEKRLNEIKPATAPPPPAA